MTQCTVIKKKSKSTKTVALISSEINLHLPPGSFMVGIFRVWVFQMWNPVQTLCSPHNFRTQTQEISTESGTYQGAPRIQVLKVNWSSVRLKRLKSLSSFEKPSLMFLEWPSRTGVRKDDYDKSLADHQMLFLNKPVQEEGKFPLKAREICHE